MGLVFLLSLAAWAGPYADLDARLRGRPDSEVVTALRRLAASDEGAQEALDSDAKTARAYIGLRATLEGAAKPSTNRIPVGRNDDQLASSWLSRALGRLHPPKFDMPQPSSSGLGMPLWITPIMWGALFLLGALAIYLLARYVRFPGRKRKGKPIAPDEPLRTADAWLEEANGLIGEGRFREAVRGLYVAGLMRLDASGVARFDPNQTNWEHLRRIESSPKRPVDSDVRGATGRFDRCWYGHLTVTAEDAHAMRNWYDGLTAQLAEPRT